MSVDLYHRPLCMVLQFSAELGNLLKGKVSPSLFATRDWDEFSRFFTSCQRLATITVNRWRQRI